MLCHHQLQQKAFTPPVHMHQVMQDARRQLFLNINELQVESLQTKAHTKTKVATTFINVLHKQAKAVEIHVSHLP
jgi:hypothetical protein